ncbi:hypothetical protein J7426_12495 [Tropicibacter sp. R16_0]|nr:hypothetical protein [Tropicibacter sp. R16_0]
MTGGELFSFKAKMLSHPNGQGGSRKNRNYTDFVSAITQLMTLSAHRCSCSAFGLFRRLTPITQIVFATQIATFSALNRLTNSETALAIKPCSDKLSK